MPDGRIKPFRRRGGVWRARRVCEPTGKRAWLKPVYSKTARHNVPDEVDQMKMRKLWARIEGLDNKITAKLQTA